MFGRILALLTCAGFLAAVAACGGGNGNEAAGGDAQVEVLRFTGIPDADKEKLTKQYAAVTEYLTKELGVKVEYVHVPNYKGAVDSLAANKVDLVWLGGVTAVDAETATEGQSVLLACRESDLHFKSYFIVNKEKSRGKVASLEELKQKYPLAELTFTFGEQLSTSGHIMPRHFMSKAGIDPEKDFKGKASYRLQGGHSATMKAVNTGEVDMGALNYKTYDSGKEDEKGNTEIVYTTPEYVDYCVVGHQRLGDALLGKIADALARLDKNNADHKAVLEAFSADKFVKAKSSDWDGIRKVLKDLRQAGIIE